MSNKIKSIIEVIGVVVSVLILILLLLILVLYVGGKFNLLKDYPVVIAGLSAALIAFLGVVVSQLWQSLNMNKNIKATQENLEKQLHQQRESLRQQLDNNFELQERNRNHDREDKRREIKEVEDKEFYLNLLNLKDLVRQEFEAYYSAMKARLEFIFYQKLGDIDSEDLTNQTIKLKKSSEEFDHLKSVYESISYKTDEIMKSMRYLVLMRNVSDLESYGKMSKIFNDIMNRYDRFEEICNDFYYSEITLSGALQDETLLKVLDDRKALALSYLAIVYQDILKLYNPAFIQTGDFTGFCYRLHLIEKKMSNL